MSVLSLTIFVSTLLVLFFVAGFVYHHHVSGGDPMRDSLLPFKKEKITSKALSPKNKI